MCKNLLIMGLLSSIFTLNTFASFELFNKCLRQMSKSAKSAEKSLKQNEKVADSSTAAVNKRQQKNQHPDETGTKRSFIKSYERLEGIDFIFDKDIFFHKGMSFFSSMHQSEEKIISPMAYASIVHYLKIHMKNKDVTFVVDTDYDEKHLRNFLKRQLPNSNILVIQKDRKTFATNNNHYIFLSQFESKDQIDALLSSIDSLSTHKYDVDFLLSTRVEDVEQSTFTVNDISAMNIVDIRQRDQFFGMKSAMSVSKRLSKFASIIEKVHYHFDELALFTKNNKALPFPQRTYEDDKRPVINIVGAPTMHSTFKNYIHDPSMWAVIEPKVVKQVQDRYPKLDYQDFSLLSQALVFFFNTEGRLPKAGDKIDGFKVTVKRLIEFIEKSENLLNVLNSNHYEELAKEINSLNTKTK